MSYHGLFHVHVTHVRIQDSIPTEITCFKNKTFKTPFLQKCTSKMCFFFFFRESNSAKLHEAHVLSGWMGYSLASHSPNLRYYKGLTDSVEIFGEMGCSEHINTTSTNLPQLYGMLMSIRIFIYIYIYISYLFGERDDIHIFYTVNCCIQRMYPWLETQPLKFSSSSPSYRNCDSVCLSSLQSIPWRRPNKQRHTRKSTFAAHVGAIQSLNVLIFV